MSYPNEPAWTCPKLDKIVEIIEETRNAIETEIESIRSDNELLREQAQEFYDSWTEAKDEVATLEAQLEEANDRIQELTSDLDEANRSISNLEQTLEA